MRVERKENDDMIPEGIPHSIGRKFRLAMTNIRRPYCFTRNTRKGMEVGS
jgi:hypothetical protein